MIERKRNETSSVFVKAGHISREQSKHRSDHALTQYARNASYVGTPSSRDYICLENRRKYTYNAR